MIETNKIYQGGALQVLKTLPSESINCVMTSPPYWALRDYGSSVETIWDAKDDCEHNFEEVRTSRPNSSGGNSQKQNTNPGANYNDYYDRTSKSNFCLKCGAWKGQLGLEPTFDLYIKHLCDIFDEVKRVLRKDGTCWVNLGDTYYSISGGKFLNDNLGSKERNLDKGLPQANELKGGNELEQKNLTLIPFRFAIEMQNRGWILRNVIIWHKPNCMPSSVKDRFTVDFEYVFFFVKNKKYWFETQYEPHLSDGHYKPFNKRVRDVVAGRIASSQYHASEEEINRMKENNLRKHRGGDTNPDAYNPLGRNKRTVWSICPQPFPEAHFATYPEELCETPIKAGCPKEGIVLDPFFGAGTTGLVALKQNKKFIGIELNESYIKIAKERLKPYLEQTKLIET